MAIYLALFCYLIFVVTCATLTSQKVKSSSDFILGSRGLNYWLTAMSAHASDMSSWLFMGYPSIILLGGLFNMWTAVGLIICMWLNWELIAPRIRVQTEALNCSTMSSFFEKRFGDNSGMVGILSALFCLIFYSVYICAGLVSLGLLFENLFNLPYVFGLTLGTIIVVFYVYLGGYFAIAWLDLIQGIFLLGVILFVPIYLTLQHGSEQIYTNLIAHPASLSLIPNWSRATLISIISMVLGWGLGYFGQPHIITKFMGIKHVSEISKSKTVGMLWMCLALIGATCIGLIGTVLLALPLKDPQMVFILLVQHAFHPFFVGLILCAIIAATINVICSQILVLSSTLSEDIYKRLVKKSPSSDELLKVSRWGVIASALIAFVVAYFNNSTIYDLVLYAWSGLGASFGPLVIYSLFSKRFSRYAAYAGILSGGLIAAIWPMLQPFISIEINALVPGFISGFILIHLITLLTSNKDVSSPDLIS